jgi:type II secretory pathway component GspD/PulD (secretin)
MGKYVSTSRWVISILFVLVTLGTQMVAAQPAPRAVSLQFSNTDIRTVLSALASQVGFNLVLGPDVKGEIDVHLAQVDWSVALNTVVAANEYTYFWNDNVLVVMASDKDVPEGLTHRVVNLRYANPTAVKNVLAGVLSSRGKIDVVGAVTAPGAAVAGRPVLVLTESAPLIPSLLSLIDSLDVPVPQFEIGVKFIETDIDNRLGVGFNWPTRLSGTVAGSGTDQNSAGPAAEYKIQDGKIWRFGTLSIDQVTGFLEVLQQNGTSRLLSDPRVTVLENEKASIKVTTTYPVQTLNRFSEGGVMQDIVSFQDLEVGITLTVVPRLNDSNQVTLDVEPVVEEITGFTGPANNERPITAKRTVKTTVRVVDGATLVIGGLVRETKIETRRKIFLLGDIPLLGALFRHTSIEKKKTDLLIFITPHILAQAR